MTSVLVLGGARSGKSTWAEARLADREVVDYVATSRVDPADAEWVARVAAHRARRPASWRTLETLDLAGVLGVDDPAPVLVDCLALWTSQLLDDLHAWEAPRDEWQTPFWARFSGLADAVRTTARDVVLVSNEVGLGVVPDSASGRLYRDELGRLNALVAGACDEVWFTVAGLPQRLK